MRASISHVMEKSARNSKCQGSRIAQKYFNITILCVNNSRRKKFCKSCHLHLVGRLEAQGDYKFYEKNWKCEYCHRVRAVGKYCKLHICLKCNSKVQIDFYTVILCLQKYISKDILRYIVYPMVKLVKYGNHLVTEEGFKMTKVINFGYTKEWCPDDLYFCNECRTVQSKYHIDNDKIVKKKCCYTCYDYCYKHWRYAPGWFDKDKVVEKLFKK